MNLLALTCSSHSEGESLQELLNECFLAFLMQQSFNKVPHVGVIPNHKTMSLLFPNCHFAAVTNWNVST